MITVNTSRYWSHVSNFRTFQFKTPKKTLMLFCFEQKKTSEKWFLSPPPTYFFQLTHTRSGGWIMWKVLCVCVCVCGAIITVIKMIYLRRTCTALGADCTFRLIFWSRRSVPVLVERRPCIGSRRGRRRPKTVKECVIRLPPVFVFCIQNLFKYTYILLSCCFS